MNLAFPAFGTERAMSSSIDPAITSVLNARSDATNQKIQMAVLSKRLDAQKQIGDAVVSMIEQAANVQSQISKGHIDVRV